MVWALSSRVVDDDPADTRTSRQLVPATSAVRKQSEGWMPVLNLLSPFYSVQNATVLLSPVRAGLPTS